MSKYNAYDNKTNSDLQVISIPDTTEPVTADEAKNYLRLTWEDDEEATELSLLNAQITNSRLQAERFIKSDILAKERKVYYDYLTEPINLYYAPIDTSEDITVVVDGVTQTEDEGYYVMGLENPMIHLDTYPAENVEITYTTKGIAANDIKFGILAILWGLYYGRDGNMKGNYKHLLYPFKVFGQYGVK